MKPFSEIGEAFDDVRLWVFDLDNTLYSRTDMLWRQVDARMTGFISERCGLDAVAARVLQKRYLHEYGLTVRGLMLHHGVEPEDFIDHAHDVDLSEIGPNPALRDAIRALPGRKVIHTNANMNHARRVLDRLGAADAFDSVYDIRATDYTPKPAACAFKAVLAAEDADPARAAMFEDAARNLLAPHALGMRTVWAPTDCDWASHGAEGGHIQFIAEDMTRFVQALAGVEGPRNTPPEASLPGLAGRSGEAGAETPRPGSPGQAGR